MEAQLQKRTHLEQQKADLTANNSAFGREIKVGMFCRSDSSWLLYVYLYSFISCGRQRGPILILVGADCGRIERELSGNAFRISPCNVLSPLVSEPVNESVIQFVRSIASRLFGPLVSQSLSQ